MHHRFALCALAVASLPLLGLASCKDATAPDDHCIEWVNDSPYLKIFLTVSWDSVPVISWTPADCPIAELEVGRSHGNCSQSYCTGSWFYSRCYSGCQTEKMWWMASDTGQGLSDLRANIFPPIRYGIRPDSATEGIPPGGLMLGDTCAVSVARRLTTGDSQVLWKSVRFVVGRGLLPSVVGWRSDQGRAAR